MPKFTVLYEARKQGAIGAFQSIESILVSDTPASAVQSVQAQLNNEGFETRFPISVTETKANIPMEANRMNDEQTFSWDVYAEMPDGRAVSVGSIRAATELEAMNAGGSLCLNSPAANGFVRTLVHRDEEIRP